MKTKIFAANWKMHKTPEETRIFFSSLKNKIAGLDPASQGLFKGREIVFFPSTLCLESTAQSLAGEQIQWGAQNCYFEDKGAFTGETSPAVLQSMGAKWCLVGHSERRSLFGETDEMINKKMLKLQGLGLSPMFCVGETLEHRKAGLTNQVLECQVRAGLKGHPTSANFALAYEPVWAIGTGVVAGVDQVQEAHEFLFQLMTQLGFSKTCLLYGGSVKPDNAGALIGIPHVDGFLVGGASLEVDSFLALIEAH